MVILKKFRLNYVDAQNLITFVLIMGRGNLCGGYCRRGRGWFIDPQDAPQSDQEIKNIINLNKRIFTSTQFSNAVMMAYVFDPSSISGEGEGRYKSTKLLSLYFSLGHHRHVACV